MMKNEPFIYGAMMVGAYLLYKSNWFNPFSSSNVANQAVNTVYQSATGSTQSPGSDLADYQYRNADNASLLVLKDYFEKKGIDYYTQQKALVLGWTPTDVDNALAMIAHDDEIASIYNPPPLY